MGELKDLLSKTNVGIKSAMHKLNMLQGNTDLHVCMNTRHMAFVLPGVPYYAKVHLKGTESPVTISFSYPKIKHRVDLSVYTSQSVLLPCLEDCDITR